MTLKETSRTASRDMPRPMSPGYRKFLGLCRTLHIYLTMLVLILLFFFSATGFLLNHEEWFGLTTRHITERTGTMPVALLQEPDRLGVVEHLRAHLGVRGTLDLSRLEVGEATLNLPFRGPGQSTDVEITRADGTVKLVCERSGLLGLLGDLHRGKDTGDAWPRIIDAVAILLFAGSATGLLLWLSLSKRRKLGLLALATGLAAALAVYFLLVP